MKITIDRSKWRTGTDGPHKTGTGITQLKNEAGCMCCLGFVCSQVHPSLKVTGVSAPSLMSALTPGLTVAGGVYLKDTDLTEQAMKINDEEGTTREEKEAALLELFADSPYELEFTGSYE